MTVAATAIRLLQLKNIKNRVYMEHCIVSFNGIPQVIFTIFQFELIIVTIVTVYEELESYCYNSFVNPNTL